MSDSMKIVLLGLGGVGKTSLARELNYMPFQNASESTLGAAYVQIYAEEDPEGNTKLIPQYQTRYADHKVHQIGLWDTAGQERFHSLLPMYYRNASIAVIVTNGSREANTYAVRAANDVRRDFPASANQIIALCYSQSDRLGFKTNPEVEEAIRPDCVGVTSAKDGTNVHEYFGEIINKYLKNRTTSHTWDTIQPTEELPNRRCCYS